MNTNHPAWNIEEAVRYYQELRNKPSDLYDSEAAFLPSVVRGVESVLDVGCAAGGMRSILREYNSGVRYTGVDVSQQMVAAAKTLFPGEDFRICEGGRLDFPDGSFDAVICLGVLNHVPDWKNLVAEMYRVARHTVLMDLPRLVAHPLAFGPEASYMVLKDRFGKGGINSEETRVPYVLTDAAEMFTFLHELKPAQLLTKGYFGKYSSSIVCPESEVCFTVACLKKQGPVIDEIVADLPTSICRRLQEAFIPHIGPFEVLLR